MLRHHVMSDFEPLSDLMASRRAQFMGGPFSAKDSWYMVAAEVGSWSLLGHGSWAIERRADSALVGQVGINRPAHFPEVEIGWVLLDGFEGHGYATEAALAALDWAWAELPVKTIVSYITPGNNRSVAVAERLGAEPDPKAPLPTGETRDETIVYRHAARGRVEACA
ncbi:GNAT family N-acetyltransferase [Ruegeria sp. HKCCD8929]|uniref:GNAT family N-acetyltransferase n=1 Tax=Ruegeria sp. HKCCD8929 TaxID=2683006 RepID=UPI00148893C8|nr:GNAT family N-acetyltransferase [Ruegeria sp. HKCCD8929]